MTQTGQQRWWKLQSTWHQQLETVAKTCDEAEIKISVCSWRRKIEMTVCYCSLLLLYCCSCECESMGIIILMCLRCLWHYFFIVSFALLYFNTLYLSQYHVATITKYVAATFTNSDVKASCKNVALIAGCLWRGIQIFRFILFCRFAFVLAFVLLFQFAIPNFTLFLRIDGFLWRWIQIFRSILFCRLPLLFPFVL